MDKIEVHHPMNIILDENENLMDEGGIPQEDAPLNEDEIVPEDANHENPILIDEFSRENVIPDDAAYQRDEDNGPQAPRRSTRLLQYNERFLEWQCSLAKQATFSGLSADIQEVKSESIPMEPRVITKLFPVPTPSCGFPPFSRSMILSYKTVP